MLLILAILLLSSHAALAGAEHVPMDTIGYQNVVQIVHKASTYLLHSHKIQWGSGSGQQSVTCISKDANVPGRHENFFEVHNGIGIPKSPSGSPVECGSIIRLKHVATQTWLHSHLHQSPLSKNQEVSCFGNADISDTGDNWKLICPGKYWKLDSVFELVHLDTNQYLASDVKHTFSEQNCRGCPINGQLETYAESAPSVRSKFSLTFSDDPAGLRTMFLKWPLVSE